MEALLICASDGCAVGAVLVAAQLDVSGLAAQLKPQFHITPEEGWMNDPNGMFMGPDGALHAFYQWNSAAPLWGPPSWGHVMSRDWAHWERLPVAVIPDAVFDHDGAFSGSASMGPDGQPRLLYTGVSQHAEDGYYYQVQATAVPANASDPTYQRWTKAPIHFQLPAGGTHAQFRDPVQAWEANGTYYSATGTQVDCIGGATLYSSPDLQNWSLEGSLATQVGLGLSNGQCTPPATPQPGMGDCDQFGSQCRTWECPDYFELDGAFVIKWSDQETGREPFSADWYMVSTQPPDYSDRKALNSRAGIFQPVYKGSPAEARRIDHGSIYASTTFLAGARRIWIGWAYETAVGCVGTCSAGAPFTQMLGYQGAQTLLREVTLDAELGALLLNPLPETAQLRGNVLFSGAVGALQPANATKACGLHCGSQRQVELLGNFGLTSAGPFSVGTLLSAGNESKTAIILNGTAAKAADSDVLLVVQAGIYVDRSASGRFTNSATEGGPVLLPHSGIAATKLQLQVFLDRSMLEAYALGGRDCVTSRIYPTDFESDWGVAAFGPPSASASMTLWAVNAMWQESTPATSLA